MFSLLQVAVEFPETCSQKPRDLISTFVAKPLIPPKPAPSVSGGVDPNVLSPFRCGSPIVPTPPVTRWSSTFGRRCGYADTERTDRMPPVCPGLSPGPCGGRLSASLWLAASLYSPERLPGLSGPTVSKAPCTGWDPLRSFFCKYKQLAVWGFRGEGLELCSSHQELVFCWAGGGT